MSRLANCRRQSASPGIASFPAHSARRAKRSEFYAGPVSSGCIFSGRRPDGGGFRETDPPNFSFRQNNCSFYSSCKALGEEVLHGADACYVWRPRMPLEWINSPRNYLAKLLHYPKLLDAENSLTYLPEFAAACIDCFEKSSLSGPTISPIPERSPPGKSLSG